MSKYLYLWAYLIPFVSFISIISVGYLTYLAPFVIFIILPSLELLLPKAETNFSKEDEVKALNSRFYDVLVYSMLPIQLGLVILFCYQIHTHDYSVIEYIGLILSLGMSCGVIGINIGHELGHRVNRSEQLMAKILLATSWYSHFFTEHNKGHHRYVSTPKDPASASLNQVLYLFWFQSIWGSFISAVDFENKRLAKKSSSFILQNEVYRWKLYEILGTITLGVIFGYKAALMFMGAALVGALLLECVNYIEHYGLRRKLLDNGRYEKVTPGHSWNSNHIVGRIVLFDLSRHSDHHANANRKYQILRNFGDESPHLPTGYPGMILLSLIPPLWFKVMNKQVKKWELKKV